MSWMDTWSRPNKQAHTPPPLYLTSDDVKYCSTCGRVIGARRAHQKNKIVKYCSDSCRNRRLGPLDKKIDKAILALLLGEEDSGLETTGAKDRMKKGDKRIVISCAEIERIVFNRGVAAPEEQAADSDADDDAESDDMDEDGTAGGVTTQDLVPEATAADGRGGSKGHNDESGELEETPAQDTRRQDGNRRAEEREKVRRAARRAVVFGFPGEPIKQTLPKSRRKSVSNQEPEVEEVPYRKCEAVKNGQVVEPSFAKGGWSIRWRE